MRFATFALLLLAGCSSRQQTTRVQSPPPTGQPNAGRITRPTVEAQPDAAPAPSAPPTRGGVPKKTREAKTYTREEFKTLLDGKTQNEIKVLLGDADEAGSDQGRPYWRYDKITRAPSTGEVDSAALVWWKEGKAERFSYLTAAGIVPQ